METWFEVETDHWYCREVGALVMEKSDRKRSAQGMAQGEYFPKAIGSETKVDFHEFLPSVELKDCYLRASGLGWDRDLRVVPYSWRKGRQVTLGEMA